MSEAAGRLVYRSSSLVRFVSWLWLALAALMIFDVVRRSTIQRSGWIAVGALLFVSSLMWVNGLRPRVEADDERVVLRNPFRDVVASWRDVTDIEVRELLRIRVGQQSYGSWAIQAGRRP